jgi:hypothetical protein
LTCCPCGSDACQDGTIFHVKKKHIFENCPSGLQAFFFVMFKMNNTSLKNKKMAFPFAL